MTKARIGITCDFETITDSRGFPSSRYVCPQSYVHAIVSAGGDPVLIPYEGDVLSHLGVVDGLLVSGGDFDVPPSFYGESPRPGLGHLIEARSATERDLIQEAVRQGIPLLGICGGMQMLNVVFGGTLYQDLTEREGTQEHQQPHDKRVPAHNVELAPDSQLAKIFGSTELSVNSTHHQLIRELGSGLVASAMAPDGVIEAVERPGSFVLGVQWHPEAIRDGTHLPLYEAFVDAARARNQDAD